MIKKIAQVINEANLVLNERFSPDYNKPLWQRVAANRIRYDINHGLGWRHGFSTLNKSGYDWSAVDKYIKLHVKPAPGSYLHTLNDWKPLRGQRLRMLGRVARRAAGPVAGAILAAELGYMAGSAIGNTDVVQNAAGKFGEWWANTMPAWAGGLKIYDF